MAATYGGSWTRNPSALPSRNPECMYFGLGPIAFALIKRTVPVDAMLRAGGVPAAQEVVVSPDAGANVKVTLKRPRGVATPRRR